MQTWSTDHGTISLVYGCLYVTGTASELYRWAHRPGAAWPCSTLTKHERVSAELDPDNGDLIDLNVWFAGNRYAEDSEDVDVDGSELTAWIDDCLAGTPYAALAHDFARGA